MNREILFRAKRIDNGEQVEGYLYRNIVKAFIILPHTGSAQNGLFKEDVNTEFSAYAREVNPETVCQYTGLKDKSDKKVFEGDILNVTYSDQQGEYHHAENYVLDDLRTTSVIGWLDYANELEVVGNIIQNY